MRARYIAKKDLCKEIKLTALKYREKFEGTRQATETTLRVRNWKLEVTQVGDAYRYGIQGYTLVGNGPINTHVYADTSEHAGAHEKQCLAPSRTVFENLFILTIHY